MKKLPFLLAALSSMALAPLAVASDFVPIPKQYVYRPNLGSLHDYCTKSPDEFRGVDGIANFRGPCARHNICQGGSTDKTLCDFRWLQDMCANCAAAFRTWNASRVACYTTAGIYFTAATIAG